MNSEVKHFIYRYFATAAIASISLGFLIALIVSNDTGSGGYVSEWTYLGFLLVVAVASLLLFVVGLCLLIFKRKLAAALILSSILLTGTYLMTLYAMEKVGFIYYNHHDATEPTPESRGL